MSPKCNLMIQCFYFLAITWTKDAVTIEPSEKYQIVDKDDGTCELIVNFATKQDNGKYVCRGEFVFIIIFRIITFSS